MTYATLGKVVVESKDMFAVVEALDVVTRGRVVGTPNNMTLYWHHTWANSPVHMVHYV